LKSHNIFECFSPLYLKYLFNIALQWGWTLQPPCNGLHIPTPHPSYLHYTHTTITATIHCMPQLHLCISTHSSEHNMYYVAPEPNITYSITLTNNYTTNNIKWNHPLTHSSLLQCWTPYAVVYNIYNLILLKMGI
jgi:hypothetical protein